MRRNLTGEKDKKHPLNTLGTTRLPKTSVWERQV